MPPASAGDPLFTVHQLAMHEGLSERVVRDFIEKRGLPCYRTGKRGGLRVRQSEFLRWLAGRRR